MKADLVKRLVEAHCSGSEKRFEEALELLVKDEEKKGNLSTASMLRDAYDSALHRMPMLPQSQPANPQRAYKVSATVPKDRESLLELYELLYPSTTFADVVLPQSQMGLLRQIVAERRSIDKLIQHGLTPSNRVLLCGPPGCGKTLTAMALAGELSLPMAYVRLDGLVSSFLGQTSTNLRKVFDSVREREIVLFLDEFDAIAKKRDDPHDLGELKRVVTTLLQNFDSMPSNVFLVAATNHEHLLDPAVWRRFNLSLRLALPASSERQGLLKRWLEAYGLDMELDLKLVTRLTEGMSGSQIRSVIENTARSALTRDTASQTQTSDLLASLVGLVSLHSTSEREYWDALRRFQQGGLSLRSLERITGIPKSTLSDKLKEVPTHVP